MFSGAAVWWAGFVLAAGIAPQAPQVPGSLRPAAAPIDLTYEDLPKLLKDRGLLMKAAALSVKASRLRTDYLADAGLPQVSVVGGGQGYQTGSLVPTVEPYGGLQASMPLYQGGKYEVEAGSRMVQLTIVQVEEEQIFRRELAGVQEVYWQLLFQRELARLLGEIERRNADIQKAASKRAAKGLVTPTEVTAFAFYGSQLQERIESAQHEGAILQGALASRLALEDETSFKTAETIPHQHDEAFGAKGFDPAVDPGVRKLEAQRTLQEWQSQRWAKWSAPSLDLHGAYLLYLSSDRSFSPLTDRLEWALGVRFSVPLYGGRQFDREAESALTVVQAYDEHIRHERRKFETDVWLHQEELKHLHHLVVSAEALAPRMERIWDETLAEYDRGVRTSQDVLSVLERLATVKVEQVERRRDYQVFKVKLDALVGKR